MAVSLLSATDTRAVGVIALLLGALTLCFYFRDGWGKPGAILDLQLIKNPSLRLAMLIYLCVPGVFTGTHMIAVLYLHNLGVGAAQIGALMLPWAAGSGWQSCSANAVSIASAPSHCSAPACSCNASASLC